MEQDPSQKYKDLAKNLGISLKLDPVALDIQPPPQSTQLSLESLGASVTDMRLIIEDLNIGTADQNEKRAEQEARIALSVEQKIHAQSRAKLPGMIYWLLVAYSVAIFSILICEGFHIRNFYLEKEVLQGIINTLAVSIVGMAVTTIGYLFKKN